MAKVARYETFCESFPSALTWVFSFCWIAERTRRRGDQAMKDPRPYPHPERMSCFACYLYRGNQVEIETNMTKM